MTQTPDSGQRRKRPWKCNEFHLFPSLPPFSSLSLPSSFSFHVFSSFCVITVFCFFETVSNSPGWAGILSHGEQYGTPDFPVFLQLAFFLCSPYWEPGEGLRAGYPCPAPIWVTLLLVYSAVWISKEENAICRKAAVTIAFAWESSVSLENQSVRPCEFSPWILLFKPNYFFGGRATVMKAFEETKQMIVEPRSWH